MQRPVIIKESLVVLAVLLSLAAVLSADIFLDNSILSLLRSIIGFVFLTFAPGLLVSRLLRLSHKGWVEEILLAVGLSIAFVMFYGAILNAVLPSLGISDPLSEAKLIMSFLAITLVLYIVCLRFRLFRQYTLDSSPGVGSIASSAFLSAILILAVAAVYLIRFRYTNSLMLAMLLLIAAIPIFVSFRKAHFPVPMLAVWVISLSLLYQYSLAPLTLSLGDTAVEAQSANLVISGSRWNPSIAGAGNAMLSLVILAPVYAKVLSLEVTPIFRVIYPFLWSLVPLGLFIIWRNKIGEKAAFLSCFFFMTPFAFFYGMPGLMKQTVAGLFLMLILLAMVVEHASLQKKALLIIFGASIAVSHYATSYVFILILIIASIFTLVAKNQRIPGVHPGTLTLNYIAIYIVFALSWYMYNAASSAFSSVVYIGQHIMSSLGEFFSPEQVGALHSLTTSARVWQLEAIRILNVALQILIAFGVAGRLIKRDRSAPDEFIPLSLGCLVLWLLTLAIPIFASGSIGSERLHIVTLIILAPYSVIGAVTVFGLIRRFIPHMDPLKMMSVVLAVVFLFNVGVIDVVTQSKYHLIPSPLFLPGYESSDIETKVSLSATYPTQGEITGVEWLAAHGDASKAVYGDAGSVWTTMRLNNISAGKLSGDGWQSYQEAYIYLRRLNIEERVIWTLAGNPPTRETIDISNAPLSSLERIYSNGSSEIYYAQQE